MNDLSANRIISSHSWDKKTKTPIRLKLLLSLKNSFDRLYLDTNFFSCNINTFDNAVELMGVSRDDEARELLRQERGRMKSLLLSGIPFSTVSTLREELGVQNFAYERVFEQIMTEVRNDTQMKTYVRDINKFRKGLLRRLEFTSHPDLLGAEDLFKDTTFYSGHYMTSKGEAEFGRIDLDLYVNSTLMLNKRKESSVLVTADSGFLRQGPVIREASKGSSKLSPSDFYVPPYIAFISQEELCCCSIIPAKLNYHLGENVFR